jgi:hypothetical protein
MNGGTLALPPENLRYGDGVRVKPCHEQTHHLRVMNPSEEHPMRVVQKTSAMADRA